MYVPWKFLIALYKRGFNFGLSGLIMTIFKILCFHIVPESIAIEAYPINCFKFSFYTPWKYSMKSCVNLFRDCYGNNSKKQPLPLCFPDSNASSIKWNISDDDSVLIEILFLAINLKNSFWKDKYVFGWEQKSSILLKIWVWGLLL